MTMLRPRGILACVRVCLLVHSCLPCCCCCYVLYYADADVDGGRAGVGVYADTDVGRRIVYGLCSMGFCPVLAVTRAHTYYNFK